MMQKKRKDHLRSSSTCRSHDQCGKNSEVSSTVGVLVAELKEHYLTARADMMLAARTKPIHGEAEEHRD